MISINHHRSTPVQGFSRVLRVLSALISSAYDKDSVYHHLFALEADPPHGGLQYLSPFWLLGKGQLSEENTCLFGSLRLVCQSGGAVPFWVGNGWLLLGFLWKEGAQMFYSLFIRHQFQLPWWINLLSKAPFPNATTPGAKSSACVWSGSNTNIQSMVQTDFPCENQRDLI